VDAKLRALELGLVLVLGCNVVCLYALVRVLWRDYLARRPPASRAIAYDPDDYGETLRRAVRAREGHRPEV
jgi:hypothetical protein